MTALEFYKTSTDVEVMALMSSEGWTLVSVYQPWVFDSSFTDRRAAQGAKVIWSRPKESAA